jgi:hypothetical protein
MIAAIPAVIIAVTIGGGAVVISKNAVKASISFLIGLRFITKDYRSGEGPLSEKAPWSPSDQAAQEIPELQKYVGKTFEFTKSEMNSMILLAQSVDPNRKETILPLMDFLDRFPKSRIS